MTGVFVMGPSGFTPLGVEDQRPKKNPVLPEAQVAHLKEIFERSKANGFSPGDFVTPTPDSGVTPYFIGAPHVVLYVAARDEDAQLSPAGSVMYWLVAIDGDGDAQPVVVAPWQIRKWEAEP